MGIGNAFSKVILVVLLGIWHSLPAPPCAGAEELHWEKMSHNRLYDVEDLRANYKVDLDPGINRLRRAQMGVYHLYCQSSGCVIRVYHGKGSFRVLVFPDKNESSSQRRFIEINNSGLLQEGIDLSRIENLLEHEPMSAAPRITIRIEAVVHPE